MMMQLKHSQWSSDRYQHQCAPAQIPLSPSVPVQNLLPAAQAWKGAVQCWKAALAGCATCSSPDCLQSLP